MSDLINDLVTAFQALPGVGAKTAQRMTYFLLERHRDAGRTLGAALRAAMDGVGHCERCRTFSEQALCRLCRDARRDDSKLCVVENPADVRAIELGSRLPRACRAPQR